MPKHTELNGSHLSQVSQELGKRTSLDKWKLNVLATIKRKLDKRAGVVEAAPTMSEKTQSFPQQSEEFTPF